MKVSSPLEGTAGGLQGAPPPQPLLTPTLSDGVKEAWGPCRGVLQHPTPEDLREFGEGVMDGAGGRRSTQTWLSSQGQASAEC